MDPDRKAIIQICRESLPAFAVLIDPKYEIPPHVDIMLQCAQKVETGEWDRVMVNCPPRHSKSESWSINFPAWFLGRHPDAKFIVITHGQRLADRMGSRIRAKMLDPVFKEIFPDCHMSPTAKSKSHFETVEGGEFLATTVNGGATGFGADCLLIDDSVKDAQDAYSPVVRQNVIEFFRSVAYTRLMPGGRIVLIQTRWHSGDLPGWLLDPDEQERVEDWKLISFPAIAERDEGWRKEGEALWPEKFPLDVLHRIKRIKGDWDWAAQYQCRPSAIEGHEIKRKWWRYYEWSPHMVLDRSISRLMPSPYFIYQSWDFATETEQQHDYTVCTTWLSTFSGEYLLDMWRKKIIIADAFEKAGELANLWRPDAILMEDSTMSKAVVQNMERRTKWPIIRRKPIGHKAVRARGVTPYIQAGRCYLPQQAPWLKDFLDEVTAFPTASHDDAVDTLSMYLDWRLEMMKQDEEWLDSERYPQEVQDPFIV